MKDLPQKYKILVVDDEEGLREILACILEMRGFLVVTASNGKEAVKKVSEESFDFVLMDIKMPVMDGITAYYNIKELPQKPTVVLMTGYSEYLDQLQKEGIVVWEKPIEVEKIFSLLGVVSF